MAEFAWDKEAVLETIVVAEKQRRVIKACVLKGEDYISITREALVQGAWKPVGGWAEKRAVFTRIVDITEKAQFALAFGTSDTKVLKGIEKKADAPRLAGLVQRDAKGNLIKEKKTAKTK